MEKKATRLSKVAREFNVGISTIVEFLSKKDIIIDPNPNFKISPEVYELLAIEYSSDLSIKKKSEELSLRNFREQQESVSISDMEKEKGAVLVEQEEEVFIKDVSGSTKPDDADKNSIREVDIEVKPADEKVVEKPVKKKVTKTEEGKAKDIDVKIVGKIDLQSIKKKPKKVIKGKAEKPDKKKVSEQKVPEEKVTEMLLEPEKQQPEEIIEKTVDEEIFKSKIEKLSGPTVVGKIKLPVEEPHKKPVATSRDSEAKKKKRKRISKDKVESAQKKMPELAKSRDVKKGTKKKKSYRPEINEEEVQKQIKDTLAQLSGKGKSKGAKYRREKRDAISQRQKEEIEKSEQEKNILNVTEFVSVNELASMMDVPVNDIISTCMSLGVMVSINQRLDAETMSIVADEFGYDIKFISVEVQENLKEEITDKEEDLKPRAPIVTVMGHVDHGKTKLLDHIRNANVIAGEAGGITQHIGAYRVTLENNRQITFLDTPGHEAFTAMRARGAQMTDIAIIMIAADDGVMPQTVEAINHAQAAGVPIIFAINKIDKPAANPEKIKEELSNMNLLVEDWGGKYQSQEISAKNGINIEELLEKVLLESEMLELKANPDKKAAGTVLESSLDKGKGFVTTLLVKEGTLKTGNITLAGSFYGHVKAMFDERGLTINEAVPSMPVTILGLNGAPQAGDTFNIMDSDREAKEIANKRSQLQREQGLRTKKHITLDEIGRRIVVGNFQELNIVVKGDVDGSVEALTDSLLKLSTEEIQLNVIHKAVGQRAYH